MHANVSKDAGIESRTVEDIAFTARHASHVIGYISYIDLPVYELGKCIQICNGEHNIVLIDHDEESTQL